MSSEHRAKTERAASGAKFRNKPDNSDACLKPVMDLSQPNLARSRNMNNIQASNIKSSYNVYHKMDWSWCNLNFIKPTKIELL